MISVLAMHPYGKDALPYTLEEEGIYRRLESEYIIAVLSPLFKHVN